MVKMKSNREDLVQLSSYQGYVSPLVTIFCTTYNHSKFLKECFEGLLSQKVSFPVEILVHDDASTDDTPSIINEYQKKYPSVFKVIFQKENQYAQGAKILVDFMFPVARGKYIAICEGDDFWRDPEKLQMQIEFLEANPDFSLSFTDVSVQRGEIFHESEHAQYHEKILANRTEFTIHDLMKDNFIPTCTMVLKKESFENCPGWVRMLPFFDWALGLLSSKNGKINYIPKKTSVYRVHESGVWSSKSYSVRMQSKIRFHYLVYQNLGPSYSELALDALVADAKECADYASWLEKNNESKLAHLKKYQKIDSFLRVFFKPNSILTKFVKFILGRAKVPKN